LPKLPAERKNGGQFHVGEKIAARIIQNCKGATARQNADSIKAHGLDRKHMEGRVQR
jgi:hypothetical protein